MPNNSYQWLLDLLTKRFAPAFWIRPGEALSVCGLTHARNPRAAAYQMITRRNYPFTLCSIKGHKMVLLADLARGIDAARVTRAGASAGCRPGHLAKQLRTARETLVRSLAAPGGVAYDGNTHALPAGDATGTSAP